MLTFKNVNIIEVYKVRIKSPFCFLHQRGTSSMYSLLELFICEGVCARLCKHVLG